MRTFRTYAARLARILFVIVAAAAMFFTAYNAVETSGFAGPAIIAALVLLWLALLWRFRINVADHIGRLSSGITELSPRAWIGACVVLGLVLRFVLVLSLGSEPQSDALYYLELGRKLAFEGRYESVHGTVAFSPPGLPLCLAALIGLVGDHDWVPLLLTSLSFVAAIVVVFGAAKMLFGEKAARIASGIVTFWPSSILLSFFATKELILIPLITGALIAYIKGRRQSSSFFAGVAGYVTGAAALVHPALLLFPSVFAVDELLGAHDVKSALRRLTVCYTLFVVAILPWSVRNYVVLDAFVPISTDGGITLYHGNNPQATGQWISIHLDEFGADEVTRDRNARMAALTWIASNPVQFAKISVRRLGYFLSGDDVGAYWFFDRGRGERGSTYSAVSVASNLYWIAVLSVIFVGWVVRNLELPDLERGVASLMFGFFYGMSVDAVVEGHPNHHICYYGLLAALASAIVSRTAPRAHSRETSSSASGAAVAT